MAYTLEQHDALEGAIADGVLEVEYSDKKVKYRTLKEMERILYKMKIDLGLIKRSGRRFAQYRSGL